MATITTTEFAEICETTPRNLRKFLRADFRNRGIETPGKGSRWGIEKRDIKSLTKRFHDWDAQMKAERAERAKANADAAAELANSDEEMTDSE